MIVGVAISNNEQVIVWHRSNWEAFVFWAHNEAWFSSTQTYLGHGGGLTRNRETKFAMEWQYHPMHWPHLRVRQASRSRQEKMEIHDMQRQSTLHAVKEKYFLYSVNLYHDHTGLSHKWLISSHTDTIFLYIQI